ncbi:peptidase M20 [Pararhizobium antarcticum]|uniref:Peptidase M20 n=2 Tax=Pararhizobium antarcticum TaxID=1798805 RepID=A0A657LSP8_9HYPH|nr:peptidase M20 [Rhizobium sp. 58]OJF96071.1 peptidase M20 [Pararhizobium antarcticum]
MTRWPSVTGSDGEAAFSGRLFDLLAATDYFKTRPEQLLVIDSHGTPARQNVLALARGKGRRCIVLAGHFDTVSIANYGTLSPLACDPARLTEALIRELSGRACNGVEASALADLESGDFLAGRGLLDMKSGVAAGIAALERFASLDEPIGNILLVATPDEENRSRGMRSLRDALPEIARKWDLEIVGGINLDATSDDGDGSEGRAIYLGSVGKFSPFAFVVGRPTHAGYAFNGVSAHLIASEIMRAIETNSALCDEAHGEVSPAPVCLESRDVRHGYEVTTPAHVWMSFNWLTHRRTPGELLADFKTIVETAMETALARQSAHGERFFEHQGNPRTLSYAGRILSFDELWTLARSQGGQDALDRIASLEADLSNSDDPLATTRSLVAALVTEAGLEGPAVIIGFSSLHYPMVHIDSLGEAGRALERNILSAAQSIEERHRTTIRTKQFFAGISDMSFFGHRPEVGDVALLALNTPVRAFVDEAPDGLLSYPVVNIGPWGRDYHQKWERLHTTYAFDILPDFIFEAATRCLADGTA